ncbi:MIP/aquaporin family protein [Aspergillus candidus]|uniref:Aquaporin-like protein n=1 Tax=Aspergillus candidus TaxID=41067 RepID=A0A2I2FG17_ASPCN|nr:aquaporin-like protein [Aspergillus candidus]PLB39568.1 aquaporin-like protein [Aspergillus candidus]
MSFPTTSKPTPEVSQTSPHILSDMLEQPPHIPPSSSTIIPSTHKKPTLYQAAVSELLGTMILVLFGDGAIAQVTLSGGSKGDYQSISWAWGLGILLGIYTSTRSGSHLNPAITFTNCLLRPSMHPWSILPVYTLAQTLGAIIAAGLIYANYHSAIDVHEGRLHARSVPITYFSPASSSKMTGPEAMAMSNATAGIFSTYPAPFMTRSGAFFSEGLASAILMFMVSQEERSGELILPLGLFFTVFGIGASFGWETGYAMNLARDFGPRLVSYSYGGSVCGVYHRWIDL